MVKRCAVQFCTDSNKTRHTMQIFPNDANLKRQFVKFVQVKIADFVEPFERSVVCSSHFSSGAVPTIQAPPEANYSEDEKQPIQSAGDEDSEVADQTEKEVELFKS
ncbi:unnamed protein product [Pocillopora meandrina]|uniref:THAP-type domain-containing protein n=1 Tax=Pocillopora meandrina TaxID=46732 RepID=A0AAU9X7U6_9CNID|nr:unnamed protein product [Pocillopora meandrina]